MSRDGIRSATRTPTRSAGASWATSRRRRRAAPSSRTTPAPSGPADELPPLLVAGGVAGLLAAVGTSLIARRVRRQTRGLRAPRSGSAGSPRAATPSTSSTPGGPRGAIGTPAAGALRSPTPASPAEARGGAGVGVPGRAGPGTVGARVRVRGAVRALLSADLGRSTVRWVFSAEAGRSTEEHGERVVPPRHPVPRRPTARRPATTSQPACTPRAGPPSSDDRVRQCPTPPA